MNAALALLQQEFPAYQFTTELVRDRTRYVACASVAGVNPHTVITPDLAELRRALEHGAASAAAPGPDPTGHAPGRT